MKRSNPGPGVLLALVLISGAGRAGVVSVSFDNNSTPVGMEASDLAGAPGVRSGHWNNWAKSDLTLGDGGQAVVDDSGSVIAGFSATVSSETWSSRDNLHSNDQEMFSDVIDVSSAGASVSVSGIPYPKYNLYVYMRDDGLLRAGSFTVGSTTCYARGGSGNPSSTGAGYVKSGDTTYGVGVDIQQGNYVVFTNLTGSGFNLALDAVNAGDATMRNKVAGFQIEEVGLPADQPTGLAAVPGNAQVELSWNAVSNAVSYNVKRAMASGGPYALLGTVADTGYSDTAVTNGMTFFYVVSAVIDEGESSDSIEVFAIPSAFVHPGGLFKQSDLERMRFQIEHRIDPWYSSFLELQAYSKSSYNYAVQGNGYTTVARGGVNGNAWLSDTDAAYCNALMWMITRDPRHAAKCVEIFNEWKTLTNMQGGGTESLNAGLFAWKMVEAAEIIRSTYPDWSIADLQAFKDMLVYPGYSDTAVPASVNTTNGTFYWRIYRGDSGRHGNQDAIAWRAMLSMGIFLDNQKMYDRALRYFTHQPGRTDDIAMPTGPSPSGSLADSNMYFDRYNYIGSTGAIADYGYNGSLTNLFWENGQCQESSRDQDHTFFNLAIAAGIADVAWNQGDPVWNAFDQRLLKGFEFSARYNTSYVASYPDQPTPWEPAGSEFIQRKDRTGRWFSKQINPHYESDFVGISRGNFLDDKRPIYEQAVAHFDVRMGLSTNDWLWTLRSRDTAIAHDGYETTPALAWIADQPGWGAICFRRPPLAAGDPIRGFAPGGTPEFAIHRLSGKIEAEHYDWFADDGEGHTYHDLTPANTGGAYRDDAVDIAADAEGRIYLDDLEAGEWVAYTVQVPADGNYGILVNYAAAEPGGTILFTFGEDVATAEFALPSTESQTNWVTAVVARNIELQAGVQVLRLHVGGTSGRCRLDSITVAPMLAFSLDAGTIDFSWPSNHPGWRLESTADLLAGGWTAIPGSDAGNTWSQLLDGKAESGFFRLIGP